MELRDLGSGVRSSEYRRTTGSLREYSMQKRKQVVIGHRRKEARDSTGLYTG